jgi:hypothetical protein
VLARVVFGVTRAQSLVARTLDLRLNPGMRSVLLSGACVFFLAMGAAASADPATARYGPFATTSPDSGTCGNTWANDAFHRSFRVDTRANGDGTFTVFEHDRRGRFVTVAGPSPGGCQTNPGGTVADGVRGRFHGRVLLIVTGAFDPDAECTAELCGTRANFIATVFGPDATFTAPSFDFRYEAGRNGRWINASLDRGGNRGDIVGAPHGHHDDDGDSDDDDDDGDDD